MSYPGSCMTRIPRALYIITISRQDARLRYNIIIRSFLKNRPINYTAKKKQNAISAAVAQVLRASVNDTTGFEKRM